MKSGSTNRDISLLAYCRTLLFFYSFLSKPQDSVADIQCSRTVCYYYDCFVCHASEISKELFFCFSVKSGGGFV